VHLPPRDADDVAEQARREAVPPHAAEGTVTPVLGQLDEVVAGARDAGSDQAPDGRSDVLRAVGQTTGELVARGGEARLVVLDQHLEDLGREVLEVALCGSEGGHIASSRDSGRN
jgi:hypothetical protein